LSTEALAVRSPLTRLPLVTLYLTDRCNSRCVTCDYWRHGRDDMDLAAVTRLLPSLAQLQTEYVLLSGGEPLLNPEWAPIAEALRNAGLKVWLLTSGLALAKHAAPPSFRRHHCL
jgi:molybdenum cofactor biosynthesis enzyme MoaA